MYLINNELVNQLPFRLVLEDGSTRTKINLMSTEELAELNIFKCTVIKPYISWKYYYGEPIINIEEKNVTYPIIEYSEEQLDNMFYNIKNSKRNEIAASRYEKEIAGVYGIKTDRESQAMLTAAVLQATLDPTYTLNWKTIDGTFVTLSAQEVTVVGTVVRTYIQSQFDEELRLNMLIDNVTTKEELDEIIWTRGLLVE